MHRAVSHWKQLLQLHRCKTVTGGVSGGGEGGCWSWDRREQASSADDLQISDVGSGEMETEEQLEFLGHPVG